MPNTPPRWIGTSAVADQLGCDTSTVHRLVSGGHLVAAMKAPGKRGAFMFDPAEVARVLQARQTASAA